MSLAIFFPIALYTIKKIFLKKDLEMPTSMLDGILPTPSLDAEIDAVEIGVEDELTEGKNATDLEEGTTVEIGEEIA